MVLRWCWVGGTAVLLLGVPLAECYIGWLEPWSVTAATLISVSELARVKRVGQERVGVKRVGQERAG